MIFKRGKRGTYYFKFMWRGKPIYRSARTTNPKIARQAEAAYRNALACGDVGILERKPAPTLAEFLEKRFEPWASATTAVKTWLDFYRVGVRAIKSYKPLATLKLDEISSERAAEFAAWRQAQGLKVSTVNASLRVLRRALKLATEWGLLQTVPKIKRLPGERHREFVLSPGEEERYLVAAQEPLASVAIVLADSNASRGMLPPTLGIHHVGEWPLRDPAGRGTA